GVELVHGGERSVLRAVVDNLLRGHGPDPGKRVELLHGRAVEVDRPRRGRRPAGRSARRRRARSAASRNDHLFAVGDELREVAEREVGTTGRPACPSNGVGDAGSLSESVQTGPTNRTGDVDHDLRWFGRSRRQLRRRERLRRDGGAGVQEEPAAHEEDDDENGCTGEGTPPRERNLGHVAHSVDEAVVSVCRKSVEIVTRSPRRQATTTFTSLRGTTIVCRISLPSSCACTFGDSVARETSSSSDASTATSTRSRTFPFTWITSSNVSRARKAGSAVGHGTSQRRSWPSRSQSSSAT